MSTPDLLGLALLLSAGLLVFAAWLVGYTAWVLVHPPRRTYAWAAARGVPGDPGEVRVIEPAAPGVSALRYESWSLDHEGARVEVWDIAGLAPHGLAVLVLHGWGDSRVTMLSRLPALASVASRVVMLEMPGHGESTGECSLGMREARVVAAALERISRDDASIVLYGFSLGAGVAIEAASHARNIAGVIAEAPYRFPRTPAASVLRSRGLPHGLSLRIAMAVVGVVRGRGLGWAREDDRSAFDRVTLAAGLRCPLLVLHGDGDEICPPEDGRAIAAAAPRGRFTAIAGAQHLTMWTTEPGASGAAEAVRSFIRSLPPPRAPSASPSPADK